MLTNRDNEIKNELYEMCSELQSELGIYAGYISDLSDLAGDCFMAAPVTDSEASEYIERCFHILSEYSYNANDLLGTLNDYINHCIKDVENEDLDNCVEQSKRLLASISEKFPAGSDILHLKNMIIDCKKAIDHLCNQKWQGGESSLRIDAVFALEEHYKLLVGLIEHVKYLLERYIYEFSEIIKREIFMACVYASPEVMMGTSPIFSKPENVQTYPYIHSFSDSFFDDKDDAHMDEIYGSSQMIPEYQNSLKNKKKKDGYKFCMYCGNKISNNNTCSSCGKISIEVDPEVTVQFCSKCAGTIPVVARYCPYCGGNLRENTVFEIPESSMSCVYASPEMMQSKNRKKGILDKLFKRND